MPFEVPTRILMLLLVTFIVLVTGATWVIVKAVDQPSYCPGGGGSEADLQESVDQVLESYPGWVRSSQDGSWRRDGRDPRADNQDLYRVEDGRYIALRANAGSTGTPESDWLVIETWCSAQEFLDDAPEVPEASEAPERPAGGGG
ncbi:MAG: hypothetical protein ACRDZ9_08145 [Acidimicrobiales bacterium]